VVENTTLNAPQSNDTPQAEASAQQQQASVGSLLRASRERLGIDIKVLADTLRIRLSYVEAIDNGRYDELPGNAYAVGFIRSYADQVGLDGDEMSTRFKIEIGVKSTEAKLRVQTPEPIQPDGFPIGKLLFGIVIVAALGYGGWSVLSKKDMQVDLPKIPASLNEKIEDSFSRTPETVSPQADKASVEAKKIETEKVEPKKVVIPKPVAVKTTPKKIEAPKPAPVKVKTKQAEALRPVTEHVEPKTVVAPKLATVKVEPKKVEAPKPAAVKVESKKVEAPKPVAVKVEPKKVEAPKPVAVKVKPKKIEAPKPVAVKVEPKKVEAPKPVAVKSEPKKVVTDVQPVSVSPSRPRVYGQENKNSRVHLQAISETWVQVTDSDGSLLLTRVLKPGDIFMAPNRPGLKLMTGNAGGLQIILDGKTLSRLGEKGIVRRNVSLDAASLK